MFKTTAVPTATGTEVKVYAGRNEFEPFIIAYKPSASGNAVVNVGSFGSGITVELYQVKYVNITTATDYLGQTGDYPDPLWPLASGATVAVTANQNTAFWFSIKVPKTTAPGDYTANMQIAGVNIPVRLHVFNMTLPDELHVNSLWQSLSYQTIQARYGVTGDEEEYWEYVQRINQFMYDHHLMPQNPLWPSNLTGSGGTPYISYDCNTHVFTDTGDEWGFEEPANNYINGAMLNAGEGFPLWGAMSNQNNHTNADKPPKTFFAHRFCGGTGPKWG